MVGLPGDSLSADLETTKKTIAIKPDMVRIYPTLVIAGTYLATMYKEGKYQPLSLAEAIKICLYMFLHFQQNGIKVIRMGLHPEEEFSQSTTLLAGPFHPSFGELVQQEIYKEQAKLLLQELKNGQNIGQVKLFVNNKDLSKLIGNHRSNVCFWQQFFNLQDIFIVQDPDLPRDSIGIGTPAALAPQLFTTRSDFIAAYLA
jgi:histone acetyltransferase (RNA polymerase elongator complex component)